MFTFEGLRSMHFVLANFLPHHFVFLSTPAVCPHSQMPLLHLDVSTPQELELHLNLYGKQEQVLLLEVPTPQRPELCCSWTCLHIGAWVAPGRVYTQEPKLHLDVSTLQRPIQHLDVSMPLGPELHLDFSGNRSLCWSLTYLHCSYRGLCCTLTCLHCVEACAAPRVVYTTVQWGLSCTWTCLDKSSLHVLLLLRCLPHRYLSWQMDVSTL